MLLDHKKLLSYDAFSKPSRDFKIQTTSGAIITILSIIVMITMFVSELIYFLRVDFRQEIFIDHVKNETMPIEIDFTFPNVHCSFLYLESLDVMGEYQSETQGEIHKTLLDESGNQLSDPIPHLVNMNKQENDSKCGSCYGAEDEKQKCCQTCEEVIAAYQRKGWATIDLNNFSQCKKEGITDTQDKKGGCRIHGKFWVNKVSGAFHISPGVNINSPNHVHDLSFLSKTPIDLNYKIDQLRFGKSYPNQKNLLEGTSNQFQFTSPYHVSYLKLVSTKYTDNQEDISSYQYSLTSLTKRTTFSTPSKSEGKLSESIPGLFFYYEISPLLIKIEPEEKSILHFIISQCGIIGGIFVIASFIDSFYYRSSCFFSAKNN